MKTITARFIGEDRSMGFRNGEVYKLQIYNGDREGGFIRTGVRVVSRGDKNRNCLCDYDNLKGFLDNWTDIKTD